MQPLSLSGRTVCIVDDDDLVRQAMSFMLREHGIVVLEAATGPDLYDILGREHLDCILLDHDLASENGLFVQDQLRRRFLDVPPVIMLTAVDNQRTIIKAFRTGVQDYLLKKGLRSEELIQSLRTAVERRATVEASQAEVVRLKSQAVIDDITGVYRREAIQEMLATLVDTSARAHKKFSLVMVRLNDFEKMQVQAGQVIAKRVLGAFAARLRKVLRTTDVCGRDEPDTFIYIVDTGSTRNEIASIITRLSEVLCFDFRQDATFFAVRADFGVASFPEEGSTPEGLLQTARLALKPFEAGSASPIDSDAVPDGPAERRRHPRSRVLKGCKIMTNAGQSVFDCTVRDLSRGGARLKLMVAFKLPDTFDIRISGAGRDQHCRLEWQQGEEIGVEFLD